MAVTLALTEKMVLLGRLEKTARAARLRVQRALASGAALAKFREVIIAQGGDATVIDDTTRLPRAKRIVDVRAEAAGYIRDVDAMAVAQSALRLGAGRERVEDRIDPAVGLSDLAQAGERIAQGGLLCRLHVNSERHLDEATALARGAFSIGKSKPKLPPLVREEIA
jgi:pyrimidine-nucleoside phosphorylase